MTLSSTTADLLAGVSDDLARAVARVGRSVVAVHGRRRGPASGVVWRPEVIVTAAHALERGVELSVSFESETRHPARLLAYEPTADVALLASEPIPGAMVADQADLGSTAAGHLALAVGRPGTPGPTASFGMVTSTGGAWRTAGGALIDTYVRADVALLPGSSGGVLADVQGRVVGWLSAYLAGGDPVAIPSASLERLVQQLRTGGARPRAYLGISTQAVELQTSLRERLGVAQASGLMLLGLEAGGPADRARLLAGDILLSIGERRAVDGEALQMALGPEVVGHAIPIRLIRGGRVVEVVVTPGERRS
jgi:S1-C subfamily serine protease